MLRTPRERISENHRAWTGIATYGRRQPLPGHIGGTSPRDLLRTDENRRDLSRRSSHILSTSAMVRNTPAPDPASRPTHPPPMRQAAMAARLPVQRLASESVVVRGQTADLPRPGNHLNASVGDVLNAIAHLPVDWRKGVGRRGSSTTPHGRTHATNHGRPTSRLARRLDSALACDRT